MVNSTPSRREISATRQGARDSGRYQQSVRSVRGWIPVGATAICPPRMVASGECHQRKGKADMRAQSVRVSAHVCSPLFSLQESHLRGRAQGATNADHLPRDAQVTQLLFALAAVPLDGSAERLAVQLDSVLRMLPPPERLRQSQLRGRSRYSPRTISPSRKSLPRPPG